MDADQIAARFYLINVALDQFKNGSISFNEVIFQTVSPSTNDINNAIAAVKTQTTTIINNVPTCNPCTITTNNTTTKYYGLTPSECTAMGGTCTVYSPPPATSRAAPG
jgi:hypothetical protein